MYPALYDLPPIVIGTAGTNTLATAALPTDRFPASAWAAAKAEIKSIRTSAGAWVSPAGATVTIAADGSTVAVAEPAAGFSNGDVIRLQFNFDQADNIVPVMSTP